MGVPRVFPSKIPDKTTALSASFLALVPGMAPGALRVKVLFRAIGSKGRREGMPSKTTPTAGPWDSPKEAIRIIFPKILPAILLELIDELFVVVSPLLVIPEKVRGRIAGREEDHIPRS